MKENKLAIEKVKKWRELSMKPLSEDFIRNAILDCNDAYEERYGKVIEVAKNRIAGEIKSLEKILVLSAKESEFVITKEDSIALDGAIDEMKKYYSNLMTNMRNRSKFKLPSDKKNEYNKNSSKMSSISAKVRSLRIKREMANYKNKQSEVKELDREIDELLKKYDKLKDDNLFILIDNLSETDKEEYKKYQDKVNIRYKRMPIKAYKGEPINLTDVEKDIVSKQIKKKKHIQETEQYCKGELEYPFCISYICQFSTLSEEFIDELVALTTGKVNRKNYSREKIEEVIQKVIDKKISDRVDFLNIIKYQNVSYEFISKYIPIIPESYFKNMNMELIV